MADNTYDIRGGGGKIQPPAPPTRVPSSPYRGTPGGGPASHAGGGGTSPDEPTPGDRGRGFVPPGGVPRRTGDTGPPDRTRGNTGPMPPPLPKPAPSLSPGVEAAHQRQAQRAAKYQAGLDAAHQRQAQRAAHATAPEKQGFNSKPATRKPAIVNMIGGGGADRATTNAMLIRRGR